MARLPAGCRRRDHRLATGRQCWRELALVLVPALSVIDAPVTFWLPLSTSQAPLVPGRNRR